MKQKQIKIGRYYYNPIPIDKDTGEPIILASMDWKKVYTLVDYDGEPIYALLRVESISQINRTTHKESRK